MKKSAELRLEENIHRETGCWLWQKAKNKKGYGQIRVGKKLWIAHRLSYALHRGVIPEGMHVLHTCDQPACINPDHLWLGTNQQNVDDKMAKRRHWTFAKSQCKNGHPYEDGSFYLRKLDNSRCCLVCSRELQRKKYRKGVRCRTKKP